MRRSRHPRPPRSGPAGLSRPLRAAASRPGIGRHRHRGRAASGQHQGHGPGLGDLYRRSSRQASRPHGYRPHALFHHRRLGSSERAAHPRRLDQGPDRHRAQRQPGEPGHGPRPARTRRRLLPDHIGFRDHRPADCALARRHAGRCHRRFALAGRGRVLHRDDDPRPHLRRPRSARLPTALHGPHQESRRPRHDRLRLGELRLRSAPRHLRARRASRRTRHGHRRRRHQPSIRHRRSAVELHLRARLLCAARFNASTAAGCRRAATRWAASWRANPACLRMWWFRFPTRA